MSGCRPQGRDNPRTEGGHLFTTSKSISYLGLTQTKSVSRASSASSRETCRAEYGDEPSLLRMAMNKDAPQERFRRSWQDRIRSGSGDH
ncbi:hypothetical protein BASA61_003530 [Batrachochytrium salamandrivorans]|nr:hypothetical protein BASA61_003530 [Batrachochytrium salamandrivorans]